MKSLIRTLTVLLMIAGWGLAALALHVIRTNGSRQFIVVPKNRLGLQHTYVDTRTWNIDDAARHAAVVQRLIDTDKYQVLSHATGEEDPYRVLEQLTDAIQRGPATTKETSKAEAGRAARVAANTQR
jgi:hypothetical protein